MDLAKILTWFQHHVTLDGVPYTLDREQAQAVLDAHQNTLVTARAGSGKTRVIVAKVVYLVARRHLPLSQIVVFMFNRTAAAEVNARLASVQVDGVPLVHGDTPVTCASTFHKFALDVVKLSGEQPKIISELEQTRLVRNSLRRVITESGQKLSPAEYADILKLVTSFIARAGQKYCGETGLAHLMTDIQIELSNFDSAKDQDKARIHQIALASYMYYLEQFRPPYTDFNMLMTRATTLLSKAADLCSAPLHYHYRNLKYILVDEYQDFSYLFFVVIQALRANCPRAHLFVVGDDWQAINRFAGSDVDYFIRFNDYFPQDTAHISLVTNYRSDRLIVENANDYMLANYDITATRAVPFSKHKGKINRQNYLKTRFDLSDFAEDRLGDGRYLTALIDAMVRNGHQVDLEHLKDYLPVAKLLKTVARIISRHPDEQIMLLHRHNFTSVPSVTLPVFMAALQSFLAHEVILSPEAFQRQIRCLTIHKAKGLEADIVILLEINQDIVLSSHPYSTIFQIFGDNLETEQADQYRLLYVALTRAKHHLYILSGDDKCPC